MSGSTTPITCTIDRDVLNEDTVVEMDDLGLQIFAKLCGANRGAFVLDPPDGKTYGCTSFPESFSTNAGFSDYAIPDSANLTISFAAGKVDPSAAVEIVDEYVSTVYASSEKVDADPYGCDANGLATLENCPNGGGDAKKKPRSLLPDGGVVRAVTLAGAFVPAPWVTGGKTLTIDEALDFYRSSDFRDMYDLGANAVQIPVPYDAFYGGSGEAAMAVSKLLDRATRSGLSAILVLVAPTGNDDEAADDIVLVDEHVRSAAAFAASSSSVIALQVPAPRPSFLSTVRAASVTLAVLVPVDKGGLENISFPPDANLFAALDVDATGSVAGAASSDSVGDRLKMFYHESITCIDRSPIEWLECYRDMPVYVTSGFDLAIDDCVHASEDDFNDYGQCERFNETVGSGWWEHHRLSLASRQLFAYSKGLGWSFSAWKLYGEERGADLGPANLLCLRDVSDAGLVPDLSIVSDPVALGAACLNGPKADFVMGDATFAPTPAPPPNCGNGWWNAQSEKCDYWVPPPPAPTPTDYRTLMKGAAGGAVAALALAWIVKKATAKDEGYQALP